MTRFCRAAVAALLALAALPASAQLPLQARLDAATFRYTEDQSLVEAYLSLGAATLPFAPTADGFQAEMSVRFRLTPVSQGAPGGAAPAAVYDQTLPFTYVMADTAALGAGQVFVEQVRLAAAPGEYELDVTLQPPGGAEVRLARDLTVPDYADAVGTALSSIQLASDIQQATGGEPLAKSGLVVRPNPDAFYGGTGAAVRYYAEVYAPPAEADEYTLLAFVTGTEGGSALPGHERRTDRRVRPVDVVAGQMDVSTLPSGIYYLKLVVLDEANAAAAEQSKRFYVINPDVERPQATALEMGYEETLFAAMGEEELALNVRHARVVATGREEAQISGLETDDQRRRFLTAFWTARDDDGIPNVNQARRTFYERLTLVNDRFNELGIEGFQTDRGRVYLKYGPPTEIDRRPFESDSFPYETWTYDNIPGEGRSLFVFVDRFSSDRYELLHSDVTGEVSIPNWRSEIIRR